MPRIAASLLLLVLGAQITASNAQGQPATDNELYAGYCLGVSEATPEFALKLYDHPPYSPLPPLPGNTQAQRTWNQKLSELNRQNQEWNRQNQEAKEQTTQQLKLQQQRFASYLMTRGVLLPMERVDAFLGVLNARRRGQGEARECFGHFDDQTRGCLAVRESEMKRLDWSKDFGNATKQEEKSWQDYHACLDRVSIPLPVCERTARCGKPDNLPF